MAINQSLADVLDRNDHYPRLSLVYFPYLHFSPYTVLSRVSYLAYKTTFCSRWGEENPLARWSSGPRGTKKSWFRSSPLAPGDGITINSRASPRLFSWNEIRRKVIFFEHEIETGMKDWTIFYNLNASGTIWNEMAAHILHFKFQVRTVFDKSLNISAIQVPGRKTWVRTDRSHFALHFCQILFLFWCS